MNKKFLKNAAIAAGLLVGASNLEANESICKDVDLEKTSKKSYLYKICGDSQEKIKEILTIKVSDNKTGLKNLEEDLHNDINKHSFYETVKRIKGFGGLDNEIEKLGEKGEFEKLRELFVSFGYASKNKWLKSTEGEAIYKTFISEKENLITLGSEILDNNGEIKDFDKYKNYLFDFNLDGEITTEKIVGVSEAQLKILTTEKNFPILLKNLNFLQDGEKISDFNKKIFENPDQKNEFHKRLVLILGTLHDAGPLFVENGTSNFVNEYLDIEQKYLEIIRKELTAEKIEESLNENYPENLKGLKEKIGKENWDSILDKIKLEGEAFSVGIVQGAGASINISKLTQGFLDNLNIGLTNSKEFGLIPVIGVSKNLFDLPISDDGNTKISSITGANFYKPAFFINLGLSHDETEDLKQIFQESKEGGYLDNFKISGNINYLNVFGVTGGITTISVSVSEMDEESFQGIMKMVHQMNPIMDNILEEIKKGTDVNSINFEKILEAKKGEKLTEQQIKISKEKYLEMKNAFEIVTKGIADKNKIENILGKLKHSALSQYANRLVKNAEGFNFIGAGVGIAFIENYLPLPFIIGMGEYIYQDIEKINNFFAREAAKNISEKLKINEKIENEKSLWNELGINFSEIRINEYAYDKKDRNKKVQVLEISKNVESINISADEKSGIQVEKKDGKIFISSKSGGIINLKNHKETSHDSVSYVLIFGEGKKDKNGKIVNGGYSNEITNGLSTKKIEKTSENIKMSDAVTEFESIKNLVQNMSHKMDKRYEKRVYEITENFRQNPYNNANINSSWRKFLNNLEKNGALENFYNFKGEIEKINNQKQKQIILESLIHNVRSDQNLKWENGKIYSYYGNKKISIKDYDTMIQGNRNESRSDSFEEQLSHDLGINKIIIDEYNDEFYKNLSEGQGSFNVNYYTKGDIIAFIGTSKGKEVFPATNVMRYADLNGNGKFEKGIDYLVLKNQKITPKMANLIPEYKLYKYLNKLSSAGVLENDQKNLDFIKKLISGESKINGVEINYEIIQSKWGDCFNTMIAIKGLDIFITSEIQTGIGADINYLENTVGNVYEAKNESWGITGIVSGELEKKDEEKKIIKPKNNENEGGGTVATTDIEKPSVETQQQNLNDDIQNVQNANPGSTITIEAPPTNQASSPGVGTNGAGNTFNNNDISGSKNLFNNL